MSEACPAGWSLRRQPVPTAVPGHLGSETSKARPAGRQVSCQQRTQARLWGDRGRGLAGARVQTLAWQPPSPPPGSPARPRRSPFPLAWVRRSLSGRCRPGGVCGRWLRAPVTAPSVLGKARGRRRPLAARKPRCFRFSSWLAFRSVPFVLNPQAGEARRLGEKALQDRGAFTGENLSVKGRNFCESIAESVLCNNRQKRNFS